MYQSKPLKIRMNNEQLTTEEQEANAFLRNRYIHYLSSICGNQKECVINMYTNTQVTGKVKAVDLNFENIIVENLKTPVPPPLKMGVLRTCDILTISYK
ncbi:gem-associated protein 7-like [Diorhabda sublineata]|uniref:gem-associated protein 7-like n=1 Tax=Diorhabda sublineata TaxID=1163346 RepID=UPI0024E16E42|nr:gem-associated protein 7-like [Diorhabda sublineata]